MLWVILGALIICADQLVKYFAMTVLKGTAGIAVIPNVFHLYYVENRGAAFGILQNRILFFVLMTVIIIGAILFYMVKQKPKSKLFYLSATCIISGAVGNLIDRIFRGFVVDMFDVRAIHFAVFNIADIFVVVGAVLLGIYFIFIDNPEDKELGGGEPHENV